MNQQDQTTQAKPISDDQELAKVLAGIPKDNNDLNFEETPFDIGSEPAGPPAMSAPPMPPANSSPLPEPPMPSEPNRSSANDEIRMPSEPPMPVMPGFAMDNPIATPKPAASSNDLDAIRKEALIELRPLVETLDLAPEEKFDIYLLLLRSTDDTSLIAPAHEAAKNIADESKKAEALLDIIKEIDFLSRPVGPNN